MQNLRITHSLQCIVWAVILSLMVVLPIAADTPIQEPVDQSHAEALEALAVQERITVRALRAWDQLPPPFISLALALRPHGIDLLGADRQQVQTWADQAQAEWQMLLGELSLSMEEAGRTQPRSGFLHSYATELQALATYMAQFDTADVPPSVALPDPEPTSPVSIADQVIALLGHWGQTVESHDGQLHILLPGAQRLILREPPQVELLDQGSVQLDLPLSLILAVDISPGMEPLRIDLDTVTVKLTPLTSDVWAFAVTLPEQWLIRDESSDTPVAMLNIAESHLIGEWTGDLQSAPLWAMELTDLELHPLIDDLSAYPSEDPHRIQVDGVRFSTLPSADTHRPVHLELEGLKIYNIDNHPLLQLGVLRWTSEQTEHVPWQWAIGHPEVLQAQLRDSQGRIGFEFTLEDLVVTPTAHQEDVSASDVLRLAQAELLGSLLIDRGQITEARLTHGMEGLYFDQGSTLFIDPDLLTLDAFQWSMTVRRFDLLHALDSLLIGFEPESGTELAQWLDGLIGEIEFNVTANGVQRSLMGSTSQGDEPTVLNVFATQYSMFNVLFSDLDTPALSASLAYRHQGMSAADPWSAGGQSLDATSVASDNALPIPHTAAMEVQLSRLPLGALLQLMDTSVNPDAVTALLLAHNTLLDLPEIHIETDDGGLTFQGKADVTSQQGAEPERATLRAELMIRNLDTMLGRVSGMLSPEEQQGVEMAATFLRMLGEEKTLPDGEQHHYFLIEADSSGGVMVNGVNVQSLLGAH